MFLNSYFRHENAIEEDSKQMPKTGELHIKNQAYHQKKRHNKALDNKPSD
jgi:hypothetical protein